MLHLDLSQEERDVLLQSLEQFVSELRTEIADTDDRHFRDMLHKRQSVLNKLIQTMRADSAQQAA